MRGGHARLPGRRWHRPRVANKRARMHATFASVGSHRAPWGSACGLGAEIRPAGQCARATASKPHTLKPLADLRRGPLGGAGWLGKRVSVTERTRENSAQSALGGAVRGRAKNGVGTHVGAPQGCGTDSGRALWGWGARKGGRARKRTPDPLLSPSRPRTQRRQHRRARRRHDARRPPARARDGGRQRRRVVARRPRARVLGGARGQGGGGALVGGRVGGVELEERGGEGVGAAKKEKKNCPPPHPSRHLSHLKLARKRARQHGRGLSGND